MRQRRGCYRRAARRVPAVLRYIRSLHPPQIRIAIVCDNFSPHLSARKDKRVGQWAAASNAEIANRTACSVATIAWRNRHTADPRLRRIVKRATAA
jgi:hypothetical protein